MAGWLGGSCLSNLESRGWLIGLLAVRLGDWFGRSDDGCAVGQSVGGLASQPHQQTNAPTQTDHPTSQPTNKRTQPATQYQQTICPTSRPAGTANQQKQPTNHSTTQLTNPTINRLSDCPTLIQRTKQQVIQPSSHPTNNSTSQPTSQPTNQPSNQSVRKQASQPVSQSASQLLTKPGSCFHTLKFDVRKRCQTQ